MKKIKIREVASVKLFEVEVSEDELDVYERCLKFIHDNYESNEVEKICGATKDELLGICNDILEVLKKYTNIRSK